MPNYQELCEIGNSIDSIAHSNVSDEIIVAAALRRLGCEWASEEWAESALSLEEAISQGFTPEELIQMFIEPSDLRRTWALVRGDGNGRTSIERCCRAKSEEEAEQILGPVPESEEYVAGRIGDSDVCRSNDYYVDGPYASEKEAYEAIEG